MPRRNVTPGALTPSLAEQLAKTLTMCASLSLPSKEGTPMYSMDGAIANLIFSPPAKKHMHA